MEAEKILCNLNEAQREAVTATEGFVRVIAGAGSGKTRALATRFAYLVEAVGILPENILCATFTNKAAAEMRARIKKFRGACLHIPQSLRFDSSRRFQRRGLPEKFSRPRQRRHRRDVKNHLRRARPHFARQNFFRRARHVRNAKDKIHSKLL